MAALSLSFGGRTAMSTEMQAGLAEPAPEIADEAAADSGDWAETALTVTFTAAAVLFVSFLAVVGGLV
jgi:hypothetical protein